MNKQPVICTSAGSFREVTTIDLEHDNDREYDVNNVTNTNSSRKDEN